MEHMLRAADAGLVTLVEYRNTLTMLTGVRLDAGAAEIEALMEARRPVDQEGGGGAGGTKRKAEDGGTDESPKKKKKARKEEK